MLIVDQRVSHEAIDLLEEVCKEDIYLTTTHALCPLDKAIFGTVKKHYNVACSEFMSVSPGNIVMKWTWPNLFSKAYASALIPNNIKQGFKACGIFPFDPTIIPHQVTFPSNPSDNGSNVATCTPDDNDIRTAQTHTATCPSANDHTESEQNTTENAKSDSAVIVMSAYDGVNPDINLELLSQIALNGRCTELEEKSDSEEILSFLIDRNEVPEVVDLPLVLPVDNAGDGKPKVLRYVNALLMTI